MSVMSEAMKNIRLIDALPTVFGCIAIAGVIMSGRHSSLPMGQVFVVGGGLLTLATALASLLTVIRRKTSAHEVVVLNTLWVLVVVGAFTLATYQLFQSFSHFTF